MVHIHGRTFTIPLSTTFTQPLHTLCIIFTMDNLPMLLVFPFHLQFCWTSRGRAWRWLRWSDMPMPCGWDVAFQVFQRRKVKKKVGRTGECPWLDHLSSSWYNFDRWFSSGIQYRFSWFLTKFPGHVRSVGRWKGRIAWHLGMWSQSPNVRWFHGPLTSYRKLEPVAWFKHRGKSQRLLLIFVQIYVLVKSRCLPG